MTEIVSPFAQFFDTNGAPLNNGAIFIGTAYLDAQTNPIPVYWDDALTIPALQPIRTLNGYVVWNGAPARIFCNADNFSMTVQTSTGRTVWAVQDATSVNIPSISGPDGSSQVGFIQAGAGAVARTAQAKMRETVSVKDFGAIGDGVAIDGPAIQAAIDSLAATGGSVFFPPGTYLFSSTIQPRANVTLWSDLYIATIKQAAGANLTTLFDFATNAANNATIRGLVIDGNKANNGNNITTERFGMFVYDANDVLIEYCDLKNLCGHGVFARDGQRLKVWRNSLRDSLMYGVYVNSTSAAVQNAPWIEANTFRNISGHSVLLLKSRSHQVHKNYVFGQRKSGQFVTVSGSTVTWVSGPDFSGLEPGNFLIYDGGIEALILTRNSNTQLTVQGTPGNRTNVAAATGAADLIAVGDGASGQVSKNTVIGGASLGISVFATTGFTDLSTAVFDNLTEATGSAGYSVQTAPSSAFVNEVSFDNNTAIDSGLNGAASDSNTLTGLYVSGACIDVIPTNNKFFSYSGPMSGMNILTPGGVVRAANNIGIGVTQTIQNGATVSLSAGWGAGAAVSDLIVTEDTLSFLVTTSAAAPSASPNITVTHRVMPARAKIPSCQNVATSNVLLSMLTLFPDGASTSVFIVNGTPSASTTYRFVVRL